MSEDKKESWPTLEEQVKAVSEAFRDVESTPMNPVHPLHGTRVCIASCGPGIYCECLKKTIPRKGNEFSK